MIKNHGFLFLLKNISCIIKQNWKFIMKKFLYIIFSFFCLFSIQNKIYAEKTNNNLIIEEPLITESDNQDLYSTKFQPEYKPAFFKMFFILIALLVLIFLTFWLFKRFTHMRLHQSNLTKNIKILEKRAISPKSMLYLIEIEGKKVVITESNLEIRKIKEID